MKQMRIFYILFLTFVTLFNIEIAQGANPVKQITGEISRVNSDNKSFAIKVKARDVIFFVDESTSIGESKKGNTVDALKTGDNVKITFVVSMKKNIAKDIMIIQSATTAPTTDKSIEPSTDVSVTNAALVQFGAYKLLIPDNFKDDYPYLSHYPLAAFRFAKNFNERAIDAITVEKLKSGSLGYHSDYDLFRLDKIKGFELTAGEIKSLDEFGIAAKRNEIISKLKESWRNYRKDYNRYLKGTNGSYKFKIDRFHSYYEQKYGSTFYEVSKDTYKFDSRMMDIELFQPRSVYQGNGWEYFYVGKFRQKYSNSRSINAKFPDSISVPLSIDDARKLFGEPDKTFCETILEVIPREGFFGYDGGAYIDLTQDFDIKKIKKYFYKESKGLNEPVLIIVIESSGNKPLY